jgi:hypothetical protein
MVYPQFLGKHMIRKLGGDTMMAGPPNAPPGRGALSSHLTNGEEHVRNSLGMAISQQMISEATQIGILCHGKWEY